jgi:hypothetical protein
MRSRAAAVALLLLALPLGVAHGREGDSAERKESGWRRHFVITSADGARLYEGTEITRLTDITDEKHILVRDEGHGDFVIRKVWNFETQTVHHRISDLKDRTFLQLSYKMPFTSRTRLDTLAEARDNPAILPQVMTVMTLETNGGTWEGSESEWLQDPNRLRALRHSVRATLNSFIIEAIERGRGLLFSTTAGHAFFAILGRYAVYDTDGEEADADLLPARAAPPNCAFDDAFGYPCTEKQKAFIRKTSKNGEFAEEY